MRPLSSLCLWSLLASLAPGAALAHAGLPETSSVTVRRGHPEDLLVGTTFGAVVSRDSGKTWGWICPDAMAYNGWVPESYLWQAHGDLLAATGNAVIRSRDNGCSWQVHPWFRAQGLWPSALASHPSEPSRVWVVTGREGSPNGLFLSEDGAETFSATALQRTDLAFSSVKVAPSDPRRLYVSGNGLDVQRVFRSEDGGESWEEIVPLLPELTRPYDLTLLRVSEGDPDLLWARISAQLSTYLLESRDGGRTFRSVLDIDSADGGSPSGIHEPLIGMEASADGGTVWAATISRFFRSRGGQGPAQLPLPEGNACAHREGDVLFVCGSTWVHDWALALTRDEGDTYEPLFSLPDIQGPAACPAGTPTHDICRTRWPQFAPSIGANPALPSTSPDAGTPSADAGTPGEEPPPKSSGCSATGGLVPAACFLVLAAFRSRRRHPET